MIAKYETLSDLRGEALKTISAITVYEQLESGIYCSEKTRWLIPAQGYTNWEAVVRSSSVKRAARKSREAIINEGLAVQAKAVTPALLRQFEQLYQETTLSAASAQNYLSGSRIYQYCDPEARVIGIFAGDNLLSGVLCYPHSGFFTLAYTAFRRQIGSAESIGTFLTAEFIQYALDHQKPKLSYGSDLNPKGIVSPASLYEFKARMGFLPFPEGRWRSFFMLRRPALSDPLFLAIQQGKPVLLLGTDSPETPTYDRYMTKNIEVYNAFDLNSHIQANQKYLEQYACS